MYPFQSAGELEAFELLSHFMYLYGFRDVYSLDMFVLQVSHIMCISCICTVYMYNHPDVFVLSCSPVCYCCRCVWFHGQVLVVFRVFVCLF